MGSPAFLALKDGDGPYMALFEELRERGVPPAQTQKVVGILTKYDSIDLSMLANSISEYRVEYYSRHLKPLKDER